MIYKNYQDRLINHFMANGSKSKVEKILLKIFKKIQKTKKIQAILVVKFALINSSPYFNIKQIQRKKKKEIEFPFLLNNNSRIFYSIKSIFSDKKKENLFLNLINASNNQGVNINTKKNIHKDAFIKKKIANYRWF